LTTFCGTTLYLALEVYTKESYTPAVNIWSFGAVIFQLAYGLPNNPGYAGRRWRKRIVEKANDCESKDLIDFLSTVMLVIDLKLRHSAQDCYKEASRLPVPSQGRCLTPTPTSYAEGKRTVVYYPGQEVRDRSLPISSNVVSTAEHFYMDRNHPRTERNSSIGMIKRSRCAAEILTILAIGISLMRKSGVGWSWLMAKTRPVFENVVWCPFITQKTIGENCNLATMTVA
jgi:serine/threonine protein kinase